MVTIWKYTRDEGSCIVVPKDAFLIHVGLEAHPGAADYNQVVFWYMVNNEQKETETHRYRVICTGDPIEQHMEYVATLQEPGHVWHVVRLLP